MKLSLIVTYRQRENHLKTQIAWWKRQAAKNLYSTCEVILVELEESPSSWIQEEIADTNIKYMHLPEAGIFHKTKALNLGLSLSQGKFVTPFDIDLISIGNTLEKHLQMAEMSPHFLVTGYRVMSSSVTVDVANISAELERTSIAPEDMPTALWKHLLRRERFGVVPFFNRERLIKIGGWDEEFVGWGGEDQDIIERYLLDKKYFCRSPELVYLHLHHERNQQWHEASLVEQNRSHYYAKMQVRQG